MVQHPSWYWGSAKPLDVGMLADSNKVSIWDLDAVLGCPNCRAVVTSTGREWGRCWSLDWFSKDTGEKHQLEDKQLLLPLLLVYVAIIVHICCSELRYSCLPAWFVCFLVCRSFLAGFVVGFQVVVVGRCLSVVVIGRRTLLVFVLACWLVILIIICHHQAWFTSLIHHLTTNQPLVLV